MKSQVYFSRGVKLIPAQHLSGRVYMLSSHKHSLSETISFVDTSGCSDRLGRITVPAYISMVTC